MPPTITKDTYAVRTDVSIDVQRELLSEQGSRQIKQKRVSLMAIAAEWLEEKAQEKKKEREMLA